MDEFIQESLRDYNIISPITSLELIAALGFSALFSIIIARVYIAVHEGYSYSKSFLHTMIMVSITVALIMIIIGSNIARAFALVGAMSIIRFRNPVKDPRDVAFLFSTIAVGMACGVKFYMFAAIFTLILVALMLLLHHFDFGNLPSNTYILKVRQAKDQREIFSNVCQPYCRSVHVLSLDYLSGDEDTEEVVYEVELKDGRDFEKFIQQIRDNINYESVNVLVGESNVNV